MRKLTAEEIAAMWLFGEEYAQSGKGAIGWWNTLPDNRRKVVRQFVGEIFAAIRGRK